MKQANFNKKTLEYLSKKIIRIENLNIEKLPLKFQNEILRLKLLKKLKARLLRLLYDDDEIEFTIYHILKKLDYDNLKFLDEIGHFSHRDYVEFYVKSDWSETVHLYIFESNIPWIDLALYKIQYKELICDSVGIRFNDEFTKRRLNNFETVKNIDKTYSFCFLSCESYNFKFTIKELDEMK